MKSIAIIGAGQTGLQLGIGLLKSGFKVSLYNNKTIEEILKGNVLSSPSMFHTALSCERQLGLNFWENICPKNNTVNYILADTKNIAASWQGVTSFPYQAVDQRLKFSRWIEEFMRLGGSFIVEVLKISDLENIAHQSDLTIVTTGKGKISELFSRDNARSIYEAPQRILCCLYITGVDSVEGSQGVRVSVIPEVGEFFITPGLTFTGPCEMMLFEGLPGGPFDCWDGITSPHDRLEKALMLLKKFVPWEANRCHKAVLTDSQATLQGSYTPIVRKPILYLKGIPILGLGDTVVLNDPIGGQGANNAAKAANFYLKKIENKNHSFTDEWMYETFEEHWEESLSWATQWTSLLLNPSSTFIDLMTKASYQTHVANELANAFDNPTKLLTTMQT